MLTVWLLSSSTLGGSILSLKFAGSLIFGSCAMWVTVSGVLFFTIWLFSRFSGCNSASAGRVCDSGVGAGVCSSAVPLVSVENSGKRSIKSS